MLYKAPKAASAGKPAVGYVRRSTDLQTQSLLDQRAAIEAYAAHNGYAIVRWFEDDAISGTSVDARGGFKSMLEVAKSPQRDWRFVLVFDISRFSRGDLDEAGHLRFEFRKAGVEIVYVAEGLTGGDADQLVIGVKQWTAQRYVKDLSRVTLRGQLSSVTSGSYLGGVAPFGFDFLYLGSNGQPLQRVRFTSKGEKEIYGPEGNVLQRTIPQGEPLTRSREDRVRLVPSSPERVAVIRRIFGSYLAGNGYRAIANALNAEGVPSPRSREWAAAFDGRWGLSSIRCILLNPTFAGDTCWNRYSGAKFFRSTVRGIVERKPHSARVRDQNPEEDWVITRNTHEPLVPRSVFDAVQEMRKKRDADGAHCRHPRGRGYYSNYRLTGLITCGDCGHRFMGYSTKSRACYKDPSLPRPRYYQCAGYTLKGPAICKRRAYPQEQLESFLLGRLQTRLQVFLGKGGDKVLRKYIKEALTQAGPAPGKLLAEVRDEKAKLQKDVDRLLENLTAANRDFVDQKLGAIRRRLLELESREQELQARVTQTPNTNATVEAALAQVQRFREVLARGTITEQKELLRGFIAGITLNPSRERGVVTWYSLPASLMFGGGTRAEAEKMQPWASQEAIRWEREG